MSSSSDDDYCCRNFDAVKLLYSSADHKGPKPGEYCIFDNLASLSGYLKRTGEDLEEKFDKTKRPVVVKKNQAIPKGEVIERRFLPHQQMIHVGHKIKGRHQRSVLTDMEKATGPMAQLFLWVTDRVRVKVLIRKNHGIRGHATGVLRLFDHHWNLVLTEVEEQYRRRKLRYGNGICNESATEKDVLKRLKELGLDHPLKDGRIKSADTKWVDIQRKHDVLFIKGDQVAVVLKG